MPKFSTLAIHPSGELEYDSETGALIHPIHLSKTYQQTSPGNPISKYEYSRSDNPTRSRFEFHLAALENAKHCIAFSSGLACVTALIALLKPECHIVALNDLYGGTKRLFNGYAKENGILTTYVDLDGPEGEHTLRRAITKQTKYIWIETPTNPTLTIIDLKMVANVAHSLNPELLVIVDNTFLTPYFQKPLNYECDIVLHSVTKYLNGHGDVVLGAIVLNDDIIASKIRFFQNALGGVPSPFDCYLAIRGMKTLSLRMDQHSKNAMAVARYFASKLEPNGPIKRVIYPGIESHNSHGLASRQQTGFGGMVSVELTGSYEETKVFCQSLKMASLAESLGSIETLVDVPARMTHASIPEEQRLVLGITDTFLRISVGIEDEEDIIEDFNQALKIVFPAYFIA